MDRADVLRLRVDECARHVEPRVVHEDVDRAGVALGARDETVDLLWVREVGRDRDSADVGHHLAEKLGVARDADDMSARSDEPFRHRFADAARGTGDEHIASPQVHPRSLAHMATEVRAEITANVWQVRTEVGAQVQEGDELVILESMKMEIPVVAPVPGTVSEVRVAPEDKIQEGDVVVVID